MCVCVCVWVQCLCMSVCNVYVCVRECVQWEEEGRGKGYHRLKEDPRDSMLAGILISARSTH